MKELKCFLSFIVIISIQACQQNDIIEHDLEEVKIESYKVSVEEAIEAAIEFKKQMDDAFLTKGIPVSDFNYEIKNVEALRTDEELITRSLEIGNEINPDTLIYVVNFAQDKGFALIAADRRTDPILAIINEGCFSINDIAENPGFAFFLASATDKIIEDINDNQDIVVTKVFGNNDWSVSMFSVPVLKVTWGQGNPYNKYCPGPYTGCVVVAVSQILSHYQTVRSIKWSSNGTSGSATLDWNRIILDSQAFDGILPASRTLSANEVAHLMRYLGLSLDATYKSDGTSIDSDNAIKWMNGFGNLNATKLKGYDETEIVKALQQNKLVYGRGYAHRAKVFGITVSYSGGHAWVYDGWMKATSKKDRKSYNLLHCNWGWNGQKNGFYVSNVFNTDGGRVFPSKSNYQHKLEYSIITKK